MAVKLNDVLELVEQTAPATPAAGIVRVYAKTSGLLYSMDDAGLETALGGGGGGNPLTITDGSNSVIVTAGATSVIETSGAATDLTVRGGDDLRLTTDTGNDAIVIEDGVGINLEFQNNLYVLGSGADPAMQIGQGGEKLSFLGATPVEQQNAVSAKVVLETLGLATNVTESEGHSHDGSFGATSLVIGGTAEGGASVPLAGSAGAIAIGDYASAGTGNQPIAIGTGQNATSAPAASAQGAIAIGASNSTGVTGARASAASAVAIGSGDATVAGASATHSNSIAVGKGSATTATNQIMLGSSSHVVTMPGGMVSDGTVRGAFIATTSATEHVATFYHKATTGLGSALNLVSDNLDHSTLQVSGHEDDRGTVKISHVGLANGADADASAISIDLQTAGTAAQGIYITATEGATTGTLLKIRNNAREDFVLTAAGRVGLGIATGGTPAGVIDVRPPDNTTIGVVVQGFSTSGTNLIEFRRASDGNIRTRVDINGNIVTSQTIFSAGNGLQLGSTSSDFGGGVFVLGLKDASTLPTTNPTGGIILYSDAGVVKYRNPSGVITTLLAEDVVPFSRSGVLAVAAGAGRFRFPFAATLLGVTAAVNTAPTGASLIADVNKNGTTIFTTQGNRPTIAASAFATSSEPVPDVTTIAAGDYLTVDVDQIGSSVAGSDLSVFIRYRRT